MRPEAAFTALMTLPSFVFFCNHRFWCVHSLSVRFPVFVFASSLGFALIFEVLWTFVVLFHALSTRSLCIFAISEVSEPSIVLIFDDFHEFCWGPAQEISQTNTLLERSFFVFAIFAEMSRLEPVLERSFSVCAK